MCVCVETEQRFKLLVFLLILTGTFSFAYWFLFCPLLYSYLSSKAEVWPNFWTRDFWILAFFAWCVFLVAFFLIWRCFKSEELKNSANLRSENSVPVSSLKKSVANRLGLLEDVKNDQHNKVVHSKSRQSSKERKKSLSLEPAGADIIHLPNFNPNSAHEILNENADWSKSESINVTTQNFSVMPFEEYLHLVQLESPSTPKSFPQELKTRNVEEIKVDSVEVFELQSPLKSPREIFFQDFTDDTKLQKRFSYMDPVDNKPKPAKRLSNLEDKKWFDNLKNRFETIDLATETQSDCENDSQNQNVPDMEVTSNNDVEDYNLNNKFESQGSSSTNELHDNIEPLHKKLVKKESKYFYGAFRRQDSVQSEIFIPINKDGLPVEEPIEMGKFQVLKNCE